jgi:hypothetical protein
MSLLLTFLELDKLYESTMSRQDLINHIKASGRNYNFNAKSTEQLFRIWEKIQKADNEKAGLRDYNDTIATERRRTCPTCGARVADNGECSKCSEDELDYVFDESITEWLDANGNKIDMVPNQNTSGTSVSTSPPASNKKVVTIVYDVTAHKLRARANDGVHGWANVAFPNNLRTRDGQEYEVDALIWNGKNYRVSGNIKPI